jgi:hypothetical protein
MTGLDALKSFRLAGGSVAMLWLEIDPDGPQPAGVWVLDGTAQALLAIEGHETAPRCDLRLAAGVPVTIACRSWKRAWPFFDAIVDHAPISATLIADDMAARWTQGEGLKTWEL